MEMGRPSRSDEHLPPQEEARIEAQARDYFDDMAPKRHNKPSRSDSDSDTNTNTLLADNVTIPIPELCKFQDLQAHSQSQKFMSEGDHHGSRPAEEYTATHYYDDLNCIDKHHHTTGSGFIQMEDPNTNTDGRYFELASDSNSNQHSSNSNPATNDWIPSAQTQSVILTSNKPTRSDN